MGAIPVTRPTPTGVLVYDGPPVTDEWFKVRREGITGTDLPKILGLSKYGTALSVWLDKRGELRDEAGEAARWGNLLEDVVAQEWALRNHTSVEAVGVIANIDHPWQRASLDRLVKQCPDLPSSQLLSATQDLAAAGDQTTRHGQAVPDTQATGAVSGSDSAQAIRPATPIADTPGRPTCGLEVKTRSAYKRGDFRSSEPDDVLAQVSWGLLVTGLDHMHIAVLIGGQELLQFRVDRDPTLETYLVNAARPVHEAVLVGEPPAVHPDAEGVLLADLAQLFPSRDGQVELPADAEIHVAAYAEVLAEERALKRQKELAKSALVQMLGSADMGLVDGIPVVTYFTPEPSDTVTADDLRALAKDNPELYAALREDGVITQTQPGPRFTLKRRRSNP